MEKRQSVILIVTVVTLLIAIGIAAYLGQLQAGDKVGKVAVKRFRARPGTTREKATALSTRKRPGSEHSTQEAPTNEKAESQSTASERERRLLVRSLSSPEDEEAMTAEEKLVDEALNAFSPETGIEELTEALKTPCAAQDAANMHAAMGMLCAQLDPADFDRAEAAFAQAMELAPDPASRQDILKQEAWVLLQAGQPGKAREKVAAAFSEKGPITPAWLELGVLLAQLHESAGDPENAEEVLKRTVDEALAHEEELGADGADVLRLAGLRLSRLYRGTNREQEAVALAKQLRTHLEKEGETE